MRRVGWAIACILLGGLIASAGYASFRFLQYSHLPRIAEMTAACRGGPAPAPSSATAAACRTYFADVDRLHRTVVTETVLCGLLAAYILLVLRLRVYPLADTRRREPPP